MGDDVRHPGHDGHARRPRRARARPRERRRHPPAARARPDHGRVDRRGGGGAAPISTGEPPTAACRRPDDCRWRGVRWGDASDHRPPAHGGALRGRHRLPARRRPADRHRRPRAARPGGREGHRAARRDRHRQVRDHRLAGRAGCSGRPWSWRRTRPWPPSSPTSSASCCRTTPSSTSSRYYDYYQPEAYIPQTDTYIEKDSSINEEVERLRHSRDQLAAHPPRRDRGRLRVLHLRPRHAAGVRRPDGPAQGRRRDRARRAAAPVRRHPVHPQRPRVHPRHLPGPRRHHRDLPGLRGARRPDRDVRRRDRGASTRCTRSPARSSPRTRSCTSSRPPTTSPARSGWSGRSPASSPSWRSGWPSWRSRASCSRPSGCGCAPPTTSR